MWLVLTLLLFNIYPNEDWGATGHRVIAEVANKYLTNKSKIKINKVAEHKNLFLNTLKVLLKTHLPKNNYLNQYY